MKRFGTTQRQLAAVAAKNHRHSEHNPLSQFRKVFTVDDVLTAASIAYPLLLPMCAPVSDGAAAAVVATRRGSRAPALMDPGPCKFWPWWCSQAATGRPAQLSTNAPAWPPAARTPRQVSGPVTYMLPKCTTPQPWAKSAKSKTLAQIRRRRRAGRTRRHLRRWAYPRESIWRARIPGPPYRRHRSGPS